MAEEATATATALTGSEGPVTISTEGFDKPLDAEETTNDSTPWSDAGKNIFAVAENAEESPPAAEPPAESPDESDEAIQAAIDALMPQALEMPQNVTYQQAPPPPPVYQPVQMPAQPQAEQVDMWSHPQGPEAFVRDEAAKTAVALRGEIYQEVSRFYDPKIRQIQEQNAQIQVQIQNLIIATDPRYKDNAEAMKAILEDPKRGPTAYQTQNPLEFARLTAMLESRTGAKKRATVEGAGKTAPAKPAISDRDRHVARLAGISVEEMAKYKGQTQIKVI